jgi:two-component system chemotaxis response regulator CheY
MARIMIVDDAAFMRAMLKNIIMEAGHEVIAEAADGDEAIHYYKQLKPDLVTLDITMPNKDGIAALKEIREYDKTAKVIMCSAMGQKTFVLEAIQNGAKDFLVKPLQKDKVHETLGKHLS